MSARRESKRRHGIGSRWSGVGSPRRSREGSELVVMGKVTKKGRVENTSSTTGNSMSAAPVETLAMRRRDAGAERSARSARSAGARRWHCLCGTLFPQSSLRGAGKLPLDYIACMASLGFLSAVLGRP